MKTHDQHIKSILKESRKSKLKEIRGGSLLLPQKQKILRLKSGSLASTNYETIDLSILYRKRKNFFKRVMLCIDLFNFFINIFTIFLFYYLHFEYVEENWTQSDLINILNTVMLIISIIVGVLLILRNFFRKKIFKEFYEIDTKKGKFRKQSLFEFFIHLLQPYPYLHYKITIKTLGLKIDYTLNMLFIVLCFLRIYVIGKMIRYWNRYSNGRSKRILGNYRISEGLLFLYKANFKLNGFITLGLLGIMIVLFGGMLFRLFEYTKLDKVNQFYYVWNSLWYVIVTGCTSKINEILTFSGLW